MHDSQAPQTLYQGWNGHWPFRQWLYIGVTNSPARRMREHRANSDWMLEASFIRLTRYPDRESVLEAERLMIHAKQPLYNKQHNRRQVEIEAAISPEDLAAMAAAVCFIILAMRSCADTAAMWWVRHLAARQDSPATLPPRPNRFTEPSVALTLFEGFSKIATGQGPREMLAAASEGRLPVMPERGVLGPQPIQPLVPTRPIAPSRPSALGLVLVALYCLVNGHEEASGSGGDEP